MKNNILIIEILALALSLSACGNLKKSVNDDAAVQTLENSLDWVGTYSGFLPCADCVGIETIVTLNQDNTFDVSSNYLGKDDYKFEETGKLEWNSEGNTIKIGETSYLLAENTLSQLDEKGNEITGNLAEHYILKKVNKQLIGRTWKLFELYGQPVSGGDFVKEPQMMLNIEGNKLNGNGTCNVFFGIYELQNGNRIRFSEIGSTMKACITGSEVETKFLNVLNTADNYNLKNDTLILNRARMAPLARFVAE